MSSWRPSDWNNPFEEYGGLYNESLKGYLLTSEMAESNIAHREYEAGADAILKSLEPLIRQVEPNSKLVDILYSKEVK